MKKIFFCLFAFLVGCASAPEAPKPSGTPFPINAQFEVLKNAQEKQK